MRMFRLAVLALAAAAGSLVSARAHAGDTQPAPVVNALARFLGVGYNAGYHAHHRDHAQVTQRHRPAGMSWNLPLASPGVIGTLPQARGVCSTCPAGPTSPWLRAGVSPEGSLPVERRLEVSPSDLSVTPPLQ